MIENEPHHITQRGNNRQDVFFADDDRLQYLAFLKVRSETHLLSILGFCLMTNHADSRLIAAREKVDWKP